MTTSRTDGTYKARNTKRNIKKYIGNGITADGIYKISHIPRKDGLLKIIIEGKGNRKNKLFKAGKATTLRK